MKNFQRVILGILLCASAQAKVFKTNFIRLDLPPNWDCRQEENDWVCQPNNDADRSEAIVTVVTKPLNEVDDSLDKYETVLKEVRDMRDLLGNPYKAQIKYVRRRQIRNQNWVDSLQLGSEIPGFYTRYVASTKEKVAGLVAYSVAESVYPKWAKVMDEMIDSMEMFYDPKAFNEMMKTGSGSLLGRARAGSGQRGAPTDDKGLGGGQGGSGEGMDWSKIIGGLVLAGAVGFYIYKKRKAAGGGA